MHSRSDIAQRRTGRIWTGTILSGIAVLFLLFDSIGKLLKVAPVVEGTAQLGYSEGVIQPIGLILLICVVAYVIPRTSIVGAILLTGYMGGAIATHVRVGSPLLTHELFPVYVAALVWGGVFLRDERLRLLLATPVTGRADRTF
jgi:DoxX-like family